MKSTIKSSTSAKALSDRIERIGATAKVNAKAIMVGKITSPSLNALSPAPKEAAMPPIHAFITISIGMMPKRFFSASLNKLVRNDDSFCVFIRLDEDASLVLNVVSMIIEFLN
jgi:hypothetical protein